MSKTPLKHSDLSEVTEDQHHPKSHNLSSTVEHIGQLPESRITYPNPPLHTHPIPIKIKGENEREKSPHSIIEFRGATVTEEPRSDKIIVTVNQQAATTALENPDEFIFVEPFIEDSTANMHRWFGGSPPNINANARGGLLYPLDVNTDFRMIGWYYNASSQNLHTRFRFETSGPPGAQFFAIFVDTAGTSIFGFKLEPAVMKGVIFIAGAPTETVVKTWYALNTEYLVEFWITDKHLFISIDGATPIDCGLVSTANDYRFFTTNDNGGIAGTVLKFRLLRIKANWASS